MQPVKEIGSQKSTNSPKNPTESGMARNLKFVFSNVSDSTPSKFDLFSIRTDFLDLVSGTFFDRINSTREESHFFWQSDEKGQSLKPNEFGHQL
jgi:hypothetical protein